MEAVFLRLGVYMPAQVIHPSEVELDGISYLKRLSIR